MEEKTAQPLYILSVVDVRRLSEEEIRAKLAKEGRERDGEEFLERWIRDPFAEEFGNRRIWGYSFDEALHYEEWCKTHTPFKLAYWDSWHFLDRKVAHMGATYYASEYTDNGTLCEYAVVRKTPIYLQLHPAVDEVREISQDHSVDIFRYNRDTDKAHLLSKEEIEQDECAKAIYQFFVLRRRSMVTINDTTV